jgi:hypothetical protein
MIGDMEVSITKASNGEFLLRDLNGRYERKRLHEIEVSVVNKSASRLIDFHPWSTSAATRASEQGLLKVPCPYAFLRVTDEFGNVYRATEEPKVGQGPAYPGKPLVQLIYLNPPVATATYLDFEFSGRAFDEAQSLVIRLPLP